MIKLSCNENPLGASPHAIKAVQSALHEMHLYPESENNIKQILATLNHVKANQITLGNGSENILELLLKTFLNKNESAIVSQYAFITIPFLIKTAQAEMITVPAFEFKHDLHAMQSAIQKNTRFIFIVNPNNPTGTYITHDELTTFLKNIPQEIMVVMDEAYIDYVDVDDFPDSIQLLNSYPNLIIVRTFSKAYGLAGLRLGYCISSQDKALQLSQMHLPFHVNRYALIAGYAALKDQTHLENTILLNQLGKKYLSEALIHLELEFIPSLCNFITVNVGDGEKIAAALQAQGILVKALTNYGLDQYIRISLSHIENLTACIHALTALKTSLRRVG